jgi:hypothetical protein
MRTEDVKIGMKVVPSDEWMRSCGSGKQRRVFEGQGFLFVSHCQKHVKGEPWFCLREDMGTTGFGSGRSAYASDFSPAEIEVGDTVRARCSGGYGHIAAGDEGTVQYISANNNPYVLFHVKCTDVLCMYRSELDLVRKARKPEIKKEEPGMKCEDCQNYKAKERRPQVGEWVEVIDKHDRHFGMRGTIHHIESCAPYPVYVEHQNGDRAPQGWDDIRPCSTPSPVTLTISDLRRELREKYGDNIMLDLAGMKVKLDVQED